jgi:hypothetical protein
VLDRADEILVTTPTRPFLELGRGMALYRCNRIEEAFETIPRDNTGLSDVKNQGLSLIFRAMIHHRLGEKFTAARLLQDAEEVYDKAFGSPVVTRTPFQDEGVVDCMLRLALKEAQTLIAAESN